ncbi:MAG: hypothetical protein AB7O24_14335 [Kofleriaceae bacterium]
MERIEFANTCDLAVWCKTLRDKGLTGPQIAKSIAKSESYVNNLIRVVERASAALLLRWKEEQAGQLTPVCATDWLVQVCLLPYEQQDAELARRIGRD